MAIFNAQQVASIWTPPQGFKFPTIPEYLQGAAQGAASIKPVVTSKVESFIAPIKYEATGVIATLEASSGVKLSDKGVDDLVSVVKSAQALANSKSFSQAAESVLSLMNGRLGFATNLFKAIPQMQQILTVAPLVGQVAQTIISKIFEAIESSKISPQQREECEQQASEFMSGWCGNKLQQNLVVSSGTGDPPLPLPADLFRHYLYGIKAPSIASMYIGLCGDQVPRGWARTSSRVIGKIPVKTRQMMWQVIEGILMSIEDPLRPPTGKDGGRALYPILQGIVWNEWENLAITATDLDDLAMDVCGQMVSTYKCDVTPANAAAKKYLNIKKDCSGYIHVPLRDAFLKTISEFNRKYYDPEKFKYNAIKGTWDLPEMPVVHGKKPSTIISVSNQIWLDVIAKGAVPALRPKFISTNPPQTVAAAMAGPALFVGGIGAAAYLIGKKKRASR